MSFFRYRRGLAFAPGCTQMSWSRASATEWSQVITFLMIVLAIIGLSIPSFRHDTRRKFLDFYISYRSLKALLGPQYVQSLYFQSAVSVIFTLSTKLMFGFFLEPLCIHNPYRDVFYL